MPDAAQAKGDFVIDSTKKSRKAVTLRGTWRLRRVGDVEAGAQARGVELEVLEQALADIGRADEGRHHADAGARARQRRITMKSSQAMRAGVSDGNFRARAANGCSSQSWRASPIRLGRPRRAT